MTPSGNEPRHLRFFGPRKGRHFGKCLARLPFQRLYRDKVLIKAFSGGVFGVRDNPGHHVVCPAKDHLPEGIRCGDTVTAKKIVVCRIVALDHPADNQELVHVAIALNDLFGAEPCPSIHGLVWGKTLVM
jgi:hypothetical protein